MTSVIRFVMVLSFMLTACGPGKPGDGHFRSLPSALDPPAPDGTCPAWPVQDGFIKDVFVNGGYGLTPLMPKVIEHLCLDADALLLGDPDQETTTEQMWADQNALLIGNPDDLNGVLLYPDDAPRYRAIFTNGGSSSNHGLSLGEEGRARFLTFFENGGSYTGSCAGAFFATAGRASDHNAPYAGLWPGYVQGSGVGAQYHSVRLNMDHPLAQKYASLSDDGVVKGVKYVGGPLFGGSHGTMPGGTEVIAWVDVSGYPIGYLHNMSAETSKTWDGTISVIAYKKDENSGRLLLNSSHPEYAEKGEVLDFMAAGMQYILEGARPLPALKSALENGVPTETLLVGDRQYHRFEIELPEGIDRLDIVVEGSSEVELYLNHACPANRQQFLHQGGTQLAVDRPEAGTWHLSVYGNHEILNGAEYQLTASW